MSKPRPRPRILSVKEAWHLTPNMIRVTFAGPELQGLPEKRDGANCKIILPESGEGREAFASRLDGGQPPVRRTFTVRSYRPKSNEMDIDFVDHGDGGPASAWANRAKPDDFLGFFGPGPVKVDHWDADFYLCAADMSAIPVVSATLEAMPRDANGLAIFEITSEADRQEIDAPEGVEMRWLVHPNPHQPSAAQVDAIRDMVWPEGRVQTCIAGEHTVIRALREHLLNERGVAKKDAYISGYWKIGLIEDEHQAFKRTDAA